MFQYDSVNSMELENCYIKKVLKDVQTVWIR